MSPIYKDGTCKKPRPHAFYTNLINKIQQIQICTITKNKTTTIQSSQKVKFEVLIGSSLARKNPLVPFLPRTTPNGQWNHLLNP